jgi:hypothetical protein
MDTKRRILIVSFLVASRLYLEKWMERQDGKQSPRIKLFEGVRAMGML